MKCRSSLFKVMLFTISISVFLFIQHGLAQSSPRKDSAMEHKTMPTLVVSPAPSHSLRNYRAAATKYNDLVNTRLDIRFDFNKSYLYGKEWVTLKPHFYPTDSLTLDAKGMSIHEVDLFSGNKKIPLKYRYDGLKLHIHLNKIYNSQQEYTLYIAYTSMPNEYAHKYPGGSAAITDNKGLYFINPHHSNPYIPTEVWTQGETEHNSVWFPTIDKPNQKTMEEISMTVPDSMTTLSNGMLISRRKNKDGTRTDTWKMTHPNSPYLFMMAAGPFVVVKDHWKNVPVDFYVEKKWAPYAREIFGHTPAMIDFYSKILGVPFQWTKYDQIVARDYVSGAMENTTATLHGEFMYRTARQMKDFSYYNESVIAHELFHQWFGDLVTCESWSNITLNESFADYSESLWAAHEYGKDEGAQHAHEDMASYFRFAKSGNDHPLVWYYYKDKEDVFDDVAYQKGGCILRMLQDYVGDSAFFASLHYYLEQHKFHPADAQELRLAFQHITGKDLNWFWNQWYYGEGYPELDISYNYNDALNLVHVIVKQTQEGRVFELPFAIDIYANGQKERHQVVMMDRTDTFTYHYVTKPDLINVDGDKVLLAGTDDHKTIRNYVYEYYHAGLYMDRRDAIEACAKVQDSNNDARNLLIAALNDKFYGLRILSIHLIDLKNEPIRQMAEPILKRLIFRDKYSSVRAAALTALTEEHPQDYRSLITGAMKDSSLLMESIALKLLNKIDTEAAYQQAKIFEPGAEPPLTPVVCEVLARNGNEEDFPYIKKNFEENGSFSKFSYIRPYLYMLGNIITDSTQIKQGVNQLKSFAEEIGPRYGVYIAGMLNNLAQEKQNAADASTNPQMRNNLYAQAEYAKKVVGELQEETMK